MRVSAKVDYAVRAAVELATAEPGVLIKAEAISRSQDIPRKFLDNILQGLRQSGLIESRRGPEGGHRLAKAASEITLADVIRAIDGPLANVGGQSPDSLELQGSAEPLREVWVAVRAALREVLEVVTLADVASGTLPEHVGELTKLPGAWERR
ncbi:MAG TPA: Rrf2 family transcriptional regulator [Solirubrobacteraceae bacterium]|nr:Rrf2 family transcriptional regulator [Solirubrobacteraceae bacterium]